MYFISCFRHISTCLWISNSLTSNNLEYCFKCNKKSKRKRTDIIGYQYHMTFQETMWFDKEHMLSGNYILNRSQPRHRLGSGQSHRQRKQKSGQMDQGGDTYQEGARQVDEQRRGVLPNLPHLRHPVRRAGLWLCGALGQKYFVGPHITHKHRVIA